MSTPALRKDLWFLGLGPAPPSEPTVTLTDPGPYILGNVYHAHWDYGNVTRHTNDWINFCADSVFPGGYNTWQYVNADSGDFTFTPGRTGDSHINLLYDNGYTIIARSPVFTVSP